MSLHVLADVFARVSIGDTSANIVPYKSVFRSLSQIGGIPGKFVSIPFEVAPVLTWCGLKGSCLRGALSDRRISLNYCFHGALWIFCIGCEFTRPSANEILGFSMKGINLV